MRLPSILVFLTLSMAAVEAAHAQIVPVAGEGTAVTPSSSNPNQLDITQGRLSGDGRNLFHSFQQFTLNQGQIANFLTAPSIQNVLGRITGGEASQIYGLIQLTGSHANLYLMNPAGIIFGSSARLNVPGSFLATTANGIRFGDAWFSNNGTNNYAGLNGVPSDVAFATNQPGTIINAGSLAVNSGEQITLLGGTVINTGTLTAPNGKIRVAAIAGEALVRISQEGSMLSLELPTETNAQLNPPPLRPLSLPELLTGGQLSHATGVTVEQGVVRLTGSQIAIPAQSGTAVVSNQLDVSGETGGTIQVLGDRVGVLNATLNASGNTNGGTVLIGGNQQGQGPLPNAQQTVISQDSTIRADALQQGDGGQVIVWANDATQFEGTVSARGGIQAGNGGFVEVSGQQALMFDGTVDVGAPAGQSGQLLLDPSSVVIGSSGANNSALDDRQILAGDSPGATFFISAERLLQALGNGSVTVAATNDITVTNTISSPSNTYQSSYGSRLVLAAPQVNLLADVLLFGDLNIQATQPLTIGDRRLESAGNLSLSTPGNVSLSNSSLIAGGNLSLQGQAISIADSLLETGGNLSLLSQQSLTTKGSQLYANGNLQMQAPNRVELVEGANPQAPLVIQTEGDLSIQGNTGITIQALNQPQSVLSSQGDLTLISDGTIVGNARFAAGQDFLATTRAGDAGNFTYNPVNAIGTGIISSNGNVNFGNYTGLSLKVEARGSIQGGDIRITGANTALTGTDPDIAILSTTPSLILRAGLDELSTTPNRPRELTALQNAANTPPNQSLGGTTFTATNTATSRGNIVVGNIETAPSASPTVPQNAVILSATGTITTGTIATGKTGSPANTQPGGSVRIDSVGSITTGDIIVSSNRTAVFRQPIALTSSQGAIRTGEIQVFGQNAVVSLTATGNIEVSVINNRSPGGAVDIATGGIFRATETFSSGQSGTNQVYSFPDRAAFTAFLGQATGLQGAELENLVNALLQPSSDAFVSIRVNPVPSYRADANSFAPPGTSLLRIQQTGQFFVSGPINTGSLGNTSTRFAPINVNALPANFSGTAGAIFFSTPNATLVQSFPNIIFQPNSTGSYIQVTEPPPLPRGELSRSLDRGNQSALCTSANIASGQPVTVQAQLPRASSALTATPCTTPSRDEAQILKILEQPSNP